MPYNVQLSQFEGPLDMLLHLVSRAKVDIKDIFISQITEQYLLSMEQVEDLDMDLASEFLQMAATLLEIKSRSLLPRPPKIEEGEEDPQEVLIRRLEEYKRFKEAGEQLQRLESTAVAMLYRLPEEIATQQKIELVGMTLKDLTAAFLGILTKVDKVLAEPSRTYIQREIWTVQECMFRIESRVRTGESLLFEDLFSEAPTRSEVVTIFLALLELWKLGQIMIKQTQSHGTIEIEKGGF